MPPFRKAVGVGALAQARARIGELDAPAEPTADLSALTRMPGAADMLGYLRSLPADELQDAISNIMVCMAEVDLARSSVGDDADEDMTEVSLRTGTSTKKRPAASGEQTAPRPSPSATPPRPPSPLSAVAPTLSTAPPTALPPFPEQSISIAAHEAPTLVAASPAHGAAPSSRRGSGAPSQIPPSPPSPPPPPPSAPTLPPPPPPAPCTPPRLPSPCPAAVPTTATPSSAVGAEADDCARVAANEAPATCNFTFEPSSRLLALPVAPTVNLARANSPAPESNSSTHRCASPSPPPSPAPLQQGSSDPPTALPNSVPPQEALRPELVATDHAPSAARPFARIPFESRLQPGEGDEGHVGEERKWNFRYKLSTGARASRLAIFGTDADTWRTAAERTETVLFVAQERLNTGATSKKTSPGTSKPWVLDFKAIGRSQDDLDDLRVWVFGRLKWLDWTTQKTEPFPQCLPALPSRRAPPVTEQVPTQPNPLPAEPERRPRFPSLPRHRDPREYSPRRNRDERSYAHEVAGERERSNRVELDGARHRSSRGEPEREEGSRRERDRGRRDHESERGDRRERERGVGGRADRDEGRREDRDESGRRDRDEGGRREQDNGRRGREHGRRDRERDYDERGRRRYEHDEGGGWYRRRDQGARRERAEGGRREHQSDLDDERTYGRRYTSRCKDQSSFGRW